MLMPCKLSVQLNAHCAMYVLQIQAEKMSKSLESQIQEMNSKLDDSARNTQDLASTKNRMQQENADIGRQLEEAESQLNQLQKQKHALSKQLEEVKANLEEESRMRGKLHNENRNLQVLTMLCMYMKKMLKYRINTTPVI